MPELIEKKRDFFVPSGYGTFELVEKKSRFIGEVWQVQSEEEAKAHLEATRKKYHDARHHCWCYHFDERLLRCSDDGEPQGTAGQPMLNVFVQEKVQEVCCVVTRYFGGTLLGPGGLVRAYSHCAKGALEVAGLSRYEMLGEFSIICPYPLFETVQKLVSEQNGVVSNTDYGVDVELTVQIPLECVGAFLSALTEKTSGQVLAEAVGEVAQLLPVNK